MFRSQKVIRSARSVQKRKKKHVTRIVAVCMCSLALFLSLAYASTFSSFVISDITIKGVTSIPEESLKEAVAKETDGSYWKLFSKKNIWLYPEKKILETITSEFPQVASVLISSKDNILSLDVVEREPFGLWCKDVNIQPCFFMDEEGFIYGEASTFSGSVYVLFTGNIDLENPVGGSYLEKDDFIILKTFIESLKELGLKPEQVHMSASSDGWVLVPKKVDIDIKETFNEKGKIMFTFGKELVKAVENLESFLSEIKLVNENGGIDAQYIDIRFGNKIFYKE
ncbi:MAG: hypothetical protein RJA61_241 [Candidatus Parcubacteria bacterium]|jgi:hypothetical protein